MLKTPDVARRLGVSEYTLKRWRRRTKEEGRQIGPPWVVNELGAVRYRDEDVEQYEQNRWASA